METPRRNGKRNGKKARRMVSTSKHPAIVEMRATLEEIGKQLSIDDFLERQVEKLRFEQKRNVAIQQAFNELDIDLFDPTSEELDPQES